MSEYNWLEIAALLNGTWKRIPIHDILTDTNQQPNIISGLLGLLFDQIDRFFCNAGAGLPSELCFMHISLADVLSSVSCKS